MILCRGGEAIAMRGTIVAIALVGLLAWPAWAQGVVTSTASAPLGAVAPTSTVYPPTLGIPSPVSAVPGGVVDPTKNVLDLVLAAVTRLNDIITQIVKRQDDLRETEIKFQNAMRDAETRRNDNLRAADNQRANDLRDAETRRVDQLAAQKQTFDLELARVIRANVDASTLLLATQVRELKTDSSERTAKLEQYANETRGRASQADPANTRLLEEVATLRQQRATTSGQSEGMSSLWALIIGGVGLLVGVIMAIMSVMRFSRGATV